jgi:D-alanine-D-alanine ligase
MSFPAHIAILTGGTSHERNIALQSAENVAKILSDRFTVSTFVFPEQLSEFLTQKERVDVVIPVFHGRGGEDGTIQGFLETLGIPYLFSGVAAHAIGMNKELAKRIVSSAGIQTSPWIVLTKDDVPTIPVALFPCVIKPIDGGSTQGVSIVKTPEDMKTALADAFTFSHRVLMEHFIQGNEFTVAVIDEKPTVVAMPVIQIKSATGFYDYEAKYGPQPAEKLCPAPISSELSQRLQEAAVTVHKTIGAKHVTRTDFIVDDNGTIWFLEVNTIPGLSVLFPRAVAASGRNFADVLVGWIDETLPNARG